ncbi:MAG: tRNA pseudouridine(38-40) synthase TruA [Cellulosilyticaceae bacterium]
MKRLKLIVAYDGTNYHGFAKQKTGVLTIQGELERAIYEITQQTVDVEGSGRTDAGVHARSQCCIVDIETYIPANKLARALNSRLPRDIIVREVTECDSDFHPRFAVKKKTYRYQILNDRVSDPFIGKYCHLYPYTLDVKLMKEAALYIVGTHDFKCFCSAGSTVVNTERTIYSLDIQQVEQIIQIDVCGSGFLYNMVRIIVGTLIEVGRGKVEPAQVINIIKSKDRNLAGPTAPPEGLMMWQIEY